MNNTGKHAARLLSVTVTGLCVGLMACSSPPQQSNAQTPPPTQSQQTQSQRYDLKGKVVSIDKSGKKLTVDHEAIPGFMGAMTMAYPVKDEHLLDTLSPGDHVTANVVSSGGEYWLDVRVQSKGLRIAGRVGVRHRLMSSETRGSPPFAPASA